MLLATMKEHFRAFRVAYGQELGENLLVEGIKSSLTDDLDSFEICDLTGFDNTLSYSDFLGDGAGWALDHERGASVPSDASNLNQETDTASELVNADSAFWIAPQMIYTGQPYSSSQQEGIVIHQTPSQIFPKDLASCSSIHLPVSNASREVCSTVEVIGQRNVGNRNPPWSEFPITIAQLRDIMDVERNVHERSPPRIESLVREEHPDSSSQQPPMVLDDINRRNQAGSEQDNTTGSRKLGAVRKLDEEYGIDDNMLHQYSDKKLKDVADILGGGAGRALDHERGANVPPDMSNLNQHRGEVARLVEGRSLAENVNNAKQNNARMDQCDINRMEEIVLHDDPIDNVENLNVYGAEQNIVSTERRDANSNNLKNQRGIKRINREDGITLADLLQHSGKKLEEVAAHFGVSRSTIKRICRGHQIPRWPPRRARHDNGSSNIVREFVQPAKEELPFPVQPVKQDLNSKPYSTQNTTTVQNDNNMVVKVTCRDYMIRFNLSVSSGKTILEEEIAKRFRLSVGCFDIKYLDEDGDWILVTCDDDLETCINIMRRLGKDKVKMSVKLSPDDN